MDEDLVGYALTVAFVAVVAFLLWLALTSCRRPLPPEPGYVVVYARDAGRARRGTR